ncbi:MAG: cytochrome c biogenesis protein CcsA [Saprospiraceae bacterium]|nr:cytochrome c biogenesis protein CcsA [Saprospiraceae bacterium]
MSEITYLGEHLFPGALGQFLIALGLSSALISAVGYYLAVRHGANTSDHRGFRNIGRAAFIATSGSVFGIISIMFYMMINKYYEYEYVWSHVSDELPFQYLFSAFWEGQQGSFLLWMFWHAILGLFLMWVAKRWESATMAVLALVQAFLLSMIIGIYITPDFRLGVTPFSLLRESEGMTNLPIFANANYLEMIKGKGLNPLLQNYWMTIHPPTLFLGFASVTIPFCYAVAGLWKKDYSGWLKPVLPWALFSGAILGTGIVMGGAWAYEALSFGGYWAWDPVENASLVPWIVLIGGIHTNLVARSTQHSIKATYALYVLAFFFILYSTFLTRSGILGDSSVHAFTEMGLEWQLVIFMVFFAALGIYQYFRHTRHIPVPAREESFSSREFWMFIGSLVLLFSAGLITFTTSLPVINKLSTFYGSLVGQDTSSWHMAQPEDPIAHYNRFQLWIAVFVAFLSGVSQYLIYKRDKLRDNFVKSLSIGLLVSALLTFLTNLWLDINTFSYLLLLFSAVFTIVSNGQYLVSVLKLKLKSSASVIAHIGFGLMIIGILASGINKQFISNNAFAMQGIFSPQDERIQKNVYLIKGKPMFMGGYLATYESDTMIGNNRLYEIKFDKLAEDNKTVEESFVLEPYLTYNNTLTEMVNPNPSTKRYLHKDIFSHITAAPSKHISVEAARNEDDSLDYQRYNFSLYDTVKVDDISMSLRQIYMHPSHPEYNPEPGDLAYGIQIIAWDSNGIYRAASPVLAIKEQKYIYSFYDELEDMNIRLRLTEEGLNNVYPVEATLNYETFRQKLGDSFYFGDCKITVAGFNRSPEHASYKPEDGDIAVAVNLDIESAKGIRYRSSPIFLIRDNRTFLVKDYVPELGLSTKFSSIDPASEKLDLLFAKNDMASANFPVEIALNAPTDDFVVLEAIEFPGINFFWLGCTMMMMGMLLGMSRRLKII